MKSNRGFTLSELLITVAIAGILATVAVPSFQGLFVSERITSTGNTLLGNLTHARSEALKTGHSVIVCRSRDGANCAGSSTSQASGDWSVGYIGFVRKNANSASTSFPDTAATDPDELIFIENSISGAELYFSHTDMVQIDNKGINTAVNFYACPEDGDESTAVKVEMILSGQTTIEDLSEAETAVCP